MKDNNLYQLIYSSKPFGFDTPTLNGLLIDSRENNARNDITGALICRSDLYLQLLEGPRNNVMSTFYKIKDDDRHVDVTLLLSTTVSKRLFPNWAMRDDPVESWMWSRKEVSEGLVNKTSEKEILNIFRRVAIRKIY